MVLTRVVQTRGDSFMTTISYVAIGGFMSLSLLLPAIFVVPDTEQILMAVAMSLCWVISQVSVLVAYRIGQVSNVAPFSYTQIIWSVIFGYLFFAEFPDAITLTGCAVVIVSGIVAARRSEPRPRRG